MKVFLTLLLIITGSLIATLVFERLLSQTSFGPCLILTLIILSCLFLYLLASLLLYGTRHAKTIAKMWLLIISLSVTYAFLDIISGVFLIRRLSPEILSDEFLHHILAPNQRLQIEGHDYSYYQTVNNLGLRGDDIEITKPSDHYRIVMLGDSFTMGKGVEDHQTFSALLEDSLNQKITAANRKKIEVLNAGVDSYVPVLCFIQLARELEKLEPDVVILNLDMSDLVQEMAYRRIAIYGDDGEIVAVPGHRSKKLITRMIAKWIDRHLYITRFLLFYINEKFNENGIFTVRSVVTHSNYEILKHTLAEDTSQREEQWHYLFDSILNMNNYCKSRGITFILTIYPWGHQVSETEWIPGRFRFIPENAVLSDTSVDMIEQFVINNNIQFLNLFPVFRAYSGESALYFSHDLHWTPTGHRIMAEALEPLLVDAYLKD